MDTPLLQQQNKKKLYGTKYNHMYVKLGGKSGPKRYKETNKSTEEPGAKTGGQKQKQGTEHVPCTHHHLRDGQATPPAQTLDTPCPVPLPHT